MNSKASLSITGMHPASSAKADYAAMTCNPLII